MHHKKKMSIYDKVDETLASSGAGKLCQLAAFDTYEGSAPEKSGGKGSVVFWPAVTFDDINDLTTLIRNGVGERTADNFDKYYQELCQKREDIRREYIGIGYLFARGMPKMSLVLVPKLPSGTLANTGWSHDTHEEYDEDEYDDKACGGSSEQLKAAYALGRKHWQHSLSPSGKADNISPSSIDEADEPVEPPSVEGRTKPSVSLFNSLASMFPGFLSKIITSPRQGVGDDNKGNEEKQCHATEGDLIGVERTAYITPGRGVDASKIITPGQGVDDDGKGNEEKQCNVETEDDLSGVERTASVHSRQSLTGPPARQTMSKLIAPDPRAVDDDGKGKEDPPESQSKIKRRKRAHNGRRKRQKNTPLSRLNPTEQQLNPGTGARVCQSKNDTLKLIVGAHGANKRTCMPIAIAALLQGNPALMGAVLSSLLSAMPNEGDMKTSQAMKALAKHGMRLERVGKKYNKKGGYPYHLLKEDDCKLIIHIKLTNTKKQQMNHCIAWDGAMLHDQPHSIRVNNAYDRKPRFANKVFEKLYPKDKFLSFQITNVFQLQLAEQREGAVVDKKKGSNQ